MPRLGPATPAPERILIYRLGSLGDTVAALPCFHLIAQAFPNSERIVLTNIPVSSKAAALEIILRDSNLIHGAIPYPIGLRDPRAIVALAKGLRQQGTSTMVYLAAARGRGTVGRDLAFFRFAGMKTIIGAPNTPDLLKNRVADDGTVERESARLARTLEASLGAINLSDRSWWDLKLTDGERITGMKALGDVAGGPFVAVNTGGKAAEKDWGTANWAALLRLLAARHPGWGLAFIGAKEDSDRAELLGREWTGGPVADLCGRVSPRESAGALKHAALFVGHDSGPLHLADAVGAPAIGIFGDFNRPAMWHPSGETTRVIHRMEGLATITPTTVAAAAAELVSVDVS